MSEIKPVQLEDKFGIIGIHELYDGTEEGGVKVPKVGYLVFDPMIGFSIVVEVRPDKTSVLSPWTPPGSGGIDTDIDGTVIDNINTLVGSGPGRPSEVYRVYIDTTKNPMTLSFHARLHYYGSTRHSVKVFLGTDITENGTVISRIYDALGNVVSDYIPLEKVSQRTENLAIWTPQVGNSSRAVRDNELLTVVVYDDTGRVVEIQTMTAKLTNFIRKNESDIKYIESVRLETPFMSIHDDRLVECPQNLAMSSLNLTGVVYYSNGEVLRLPIDGRRFTLAGMDRFSTTVLGRESDLVLIYTLDEQEQFITGSDELDGKRSESYRVKVIPVDGTYSLKLFSYPEWIDPVAGYRLRHWLYSLDRNFAFEVTGMVSLTESSADFKPTLYGTQQTLDVGINIKDVNPILPSYVHVQTINFTLRSRGDQEENNWVVYFSDDKGSYGNGLRADMSYKSASHFGYDLRCGAVGVDDWLEKLYYSTLPLFNPNSESQPLKPTRVEVQIGADVVDISTDQWDTELSSDQELANGKNVYLRFYRNTANGNLHLATAALPVWKIN